MWFNLYNFMTDSDSLNATPAYPQTFNSVEFKDAIFDEYIINQEIESVADTDKEEWGYYTILLAQFKNSLNFGNVEFASDSVSKLRIKRRKIEELSDWWTIAEIDFSTNLQFDVFDYLTESEQEYEYSIVPVSSNNTEGNLFTNTVLSQFQDTYITDCNSIYKLRYNLNYDSISRIQKTATFEPLESRYPIVVKNASTNYETGSISSLILSESTENANGVIDKKQESRHRKQLVDFLTNSKSKYIKDANGNTWLVFCTGNPNIQFRNELGQQVADVNFDWTEVGSADSKEDLFYNGLLPSLS